MSYYIGDIGYYEGDRLDPADTEVSKRPSPIHDYSNGQWVENHTKKSKEIQNQIDALEETTLMNRFVREGMLAIAEKTAADLNVTQPQLYASNIGYKRIKDLDNQIAELRGQL